VKRLKRVVCKAIGHGERQLVEGVLQGVLTRAIICKRCHYVFEARLVSKRQVRRAQAKRT
jgi:hypothetical protein